MAVPAAAGERRDGYATRPTLPPCLRDTPALGRAVLAAVIAAICEEAGRVVTPDEVRAVIRALREEAEGKSWNVRSRGRR